MNYRPTHIFDKGEPLGWLSKKLFLHIACWTAYICFELFSLKYFYGKLESSFNYGYYYVVNIAWFYAIVRNLQAPLRNQEYRFIKRLFLLLLTIAIFLLFKFLGAYLFYDYAIFIKHLRHPFTFTITNLYRGSVFAFLAIFYYLASHLADYRQKTLEAENAQLATLKEKAELETKLIKSQNAYLQQQLNPHFLFNALNFVYSQVFKHSKHGAKALQLLSDILRYSLDQGAGEGKTSLDHEIQQIKNLVDINRYRYDTPLALNVSYHGVFENYHFIPLILLTLTENVFKHGNLRDPENPAVLHIEMDEAGQLYYHSRNLKKAGSGHQRLQSIGLKNIRIRLDYTYPEKYQLDIQNSEDYFDLKLKIAL